MLWSLLVSAALADDYVLVVHRDVPQQSISARALRRLISKQDCCWSDGLQAVAVLPPNDDAATMWFSETLTGLEPEVFHRYLMERCYRMGCTPRVGVTDLAAAHEVAARTPGAITIARVGAIPDGLQELTVTR